MSPEAWTAAGNAVAFIAAGAAAVWARQASIKSTPTSNGFAECVRSSLGRIEERLDRMETRQDRFEDRFVSHVLNSER